MNRQSSLTRPSQVKMHWTYLYFLLFTGNLYFGPLLVVSAQSPAETIDRKTLETQVSQGFEAASAGWSVDEVILHDERRRAFLSSCREAGATLSEKELFETLLRIRKGGRLSVRATQSERTSLDDYTIAAEIAARRLADEKKANFDQILCDPELLKAFDQIAAELSPKTENYLLRKAALRLRKSRQLQPELVAQATNWNVTLSDYSLPQLTELLPNLTTRPGIYIFRDATGYLYIGQSNNLRERLTHHLKESDRDQLRRYLIEKAGAELKIELHEFQPGSPGESLKSRRAYESELIRSRQPRLNLAP